MKYNDNGEYKDIYVKAFDTLPVGTEVDYDGSVVPSGWEQITNKSDILWTNPHSGTTIDGNAKTVQIDLSNYDSYEIVYINGSVSSTTEDYSLSTTGIIPKTRRAVLTCPSLRFLGFRQITAISDSSISWGDYGFYETYGSSTLSYNNTFCVVQYIIGHNTGLYS